MLWKINFVIDTGYDWIHRACVMMAETKEKALDNLRTWEIENLHGENVIVDSETKIEKVDYNNKYGIIYQDWTK